MTLRTRLEPVIFRARRLRNQVERFCAENFISRRRPRWFSPRDSTRLVIVSGFVKTGSSACIALLREIEGVSCVSPEFQLFRRNIWPLLQADQVEPRTYLERLSELSYELQEAGRMKSSRQTWIDRTARLLSKHQNSPRLGLNRELSGYYNAYTRVYLKELQRLAIVPHSAARRRAIGEVSVRYIHSLASVMASRDGADIVLLNQTLKPSARTISGLDLIDPIKLVVVDRDPRNQYAELANSGRLNGLLDGYLRQMKGTKPDATRVGRFIQVYRAVRTQFYDTFQDRPHHRLIVVRFEELATDPHAAVRLLSSFLGINESRIWHENRFFDQQRAKARVTIWRHYSPQNEMTSIQSELSEYCFIGNDDSVVA